MTIDDAAFNLGVVGRQGTQRFARPHGLLFDRFATAWGRRGLVGTEEGDQKKRAKKWYNKHM
jgi:hypothetical protein